MNKNLFLSLGVFLLGAVLMVAPAVSVYAQEINPDVERTAAQTAFDAERAAAQAAYEAERAAALAEGDAAALARNAERVRAAIELEALRERQEEAHEDQMFINTLGYVGGDLVNRTIQQSIDEQMRTQSALDYQDFWLQERESRYQIDQQLRDQALQEQAIYEQQRTADEAAHIQTRDLLLDEHERDLQQRQQAVESELNARDISQPRPNRQIAASFCREGQQCVSDAINNFGRNLTTLPSLFYIMSYTAGVFFMAMGLLKANRTINDPSRHPLSDAVKYAGAGVFLSALPVTTTALHNSFGWNSGSLTLDYGRGMQGASGQDGAAQGLDQFAVNLVRDLGEPMLSIVALFGFVAGVFLLFTGLQRLTKGAQEGPKGPAGLGTIMTFVTGSALISFVPSLRAVLGSVFGNDTVMAFPDMSVLVDRLGADAAAMTQSTAVITSLLAFLAIVGVISFARGLFMLKNTADGAQNASLMGSISHLLAGVCCVNFGAVANMLQNTLGLAEFGIPFTQ